MIRPAAPLPWRAQEWTSHAASTVVIDDQQSPTGVSIVAECEAYDPTDRVRDAAYIAHAANAYPKLIEALRALQQRMDGCQLGPVNGGRDEADAIAAEAEESRALLRELGEVT